MSELERAENETQTELTSTQKESGSYTKGKVTLKNIPITIENPKGTLRSGISPQGKSWKIQLPYTYGYIDNSVGNDGDEVDIFLGPLADTEQDFLVYIINQIEPSTGRFDEHKVMFGFSNWSEAKKAYLSCYESGWKGFSSMDQISLNGFSSWIKTKSNEVFINQLNPKKNEVILEKNEKIKLIKLEGEIFEGETLLGLQQQAGDLKNIKTLVISIGSPGGDVSEGIKIMMWFDYLSSIGIKVVTLVVSNAYSIASLIMLAADHILIAKDADVMVHNPMIPELRLVNANELEQHIKELRELESTMYELYEIFTGLTIEEIKKLMDNETYLSASDAVKYGFAHEVANIEKKPKIMAISKFKTVNMKKTLNILHQVIAMVGGSSIVNQSYYDDKGGEIEIYQQEPSTYTTGDRTSVESGEVKLQDGSVLHIKDYVVESIDKSSAVSVEELISTQEEKVPEQAVPVVSNFNQGPPPVEPIKTEEQKPTEMKTEVTKTETTKTEPVAVLPPTEEMSPTTEQPILEDEGKKTVEVSLEEFQGLVKNYTELKAQVEKLMSNQGEVQKRMKESSDFEEIATEAIQMIAQNTTSTFSPTARAVATEERKGSIFQQAKMKVVESKSSPK